MRSRKHPLGRYLPNICRLVHLQQAKPIPRILRMVFLANCSIGWAQIGSRLQFAVCWTAAWCSLNTETTHAVEQLAESHGHIARFIACSVDALPVSPYASHAA